MRLPSIRLTCVAFTLFCVLLLGIAAYLQFAKGIEPCPLCILQRLVIAMLAAGFFIGSFLKPLQKFRSWYFVFIALIAGLGLGLACRQLWLMQQPPDQFASCTADIGYLINNLPLLKVLEFVLQGDTSCVEQQWSFFSLNIPQWSALCFVIMLAGALVLALYKR